MNRLDRTAIVAAAVINRIPLNGQETDYEIVQRAMKVFEHLLENLPITQLEAQVSKQSEL